MQTSNIMSVHSASAHRIQRGGLGYSRPLTDDELIKTAPAIFAPEAHQSRSERYTYIPTLDLITAMRADGFLPVKVTQSGARTEDRKGFSKHLIRFRREDQLAAAEAREVILLNSHDGGSAFKLMAGVFRLVCSNGLITGRNDSEITVRHSGEAIGKVIEGAYSIVNEFDKVEESIEGMKSVKLLPEQRAALGKAALAIRFDDPANCGITADQLIRPRRTADEAPDLWSTFNVIQENVIRGGLHGRKVAANGRRVRTSTRAVNGIDQTVQLNRGLWVLAEEMRKLAS